MGWPLYLIRICVLVACEFRGDVVQLTNEHGDRYRGICNQLDTKLRLIVHLIAKRYRYHFIVLCHLRGKRPQRVSHFLILAGKGTFFGLTGLHPYS